MLWHACIATFSWFGKLVRHEISFSHATNSGHVMLQESMSQFFSSKKFWKLGQSPHAEVCA